MIDVEDFRAAAIRLLAKLPRIDAVDERSGDAHPRVEIEAGNLMVLAYAGQDAEPLAFHGLEQHAAGSVPWGAWKAFQLDAEGNLIVGDRRHRVRRLDFDDARAEAAVKSWPEFAKARKVRGPA